MESCGSRKNIDELYQNLTGVKIDEQLKLWDARGKGYYGEYLLFTELYNKVPGRCKILMNLQIPSEQGKTTEIDLLLIHETGLYVFEAKHYKGTIYGKIGEERWTQYFRTTTNQSFNSPIMQNKWHIAQLSRLYPELPVRSFIVFTNEECRLNVEGRMENTTLCNLKDMTSCLGEACSRAAVCMTAERIDEVFNELKIHSPIQMDSILCDGVVMNLYEFVERTVAAHGENLRKAESEHLEKMQAAEQNHLEKMKIAEQSHLEKMKIAEQSYKKKEEEVEKRRQITKRRAILAVAATLIVCFSLTANHKQEKQDAIKQASAKIAEVDAQIERYRAAADADLAKHKAQADAEIEQYKKQADTEIEQYRAEAEAARAEQQKFAEKWQIVTDFEVDGKLLSKDFVTVDDVVLKDSADFGDLVKLSCTLTHNGEDYYALIDKSSMFTVVLKDGRVLEFPCYSSSYSSYSLGYSSSSKTLQVKNFEFSGFTVDEVAVIKLNNMQIKRIKYVYGEQALSDYEAVIYTAK